MNSPQENSAPAPAWMQALENKRKRVHRLAHEIGAGSPCLTCGKGCPGLDLHFWRKLCRNCKCKKEDHDVVDDCGYEQFELLLGSSHTKKKPGRAFLNIHETHHDKVEEDEPPAKKVAFDWIPPDVSADLAAEYMAALPTGKLPISGSDGALYRRQQLERQLPLHDLDAEQCHQLTPAEVEKLKEYLNNLRQNVVGQGRIAKMPMHTSQSADSLQLSSIYHSVPKPFHASVNPPAAQDSKIPGEDWPPPPATDTTGPAVSLKPPSAFLPKERKSPIPKDFQRSASPNYAAEAPSKLVKDVAQGDIAYSSVANRGALFGVMLTPPRSRSSVQSSPTRSLEVEGQSRDASPSYSLDRNRAPRGDLAHSSSLPQQQQTQSLHSQAEKRPGGLNKNSSALNSDAYNSRINSRGSSPSRGYEATQEIIGRPAVDIGSSSNVPGQHYKPPYPAVYHSPINSRGSSPMRGFEATQELIERPVVNISSSSTVPGQYYKSPDPAIYQSPADSRGSSPSLGYDASRELITGPMSDVATSSIVPGRYLAPGTYRSPVNSRGHSPSGRYDAAQELIGRPAEDISSSSDVAGQRHQAIIPGAYESSATSRGRSPAIGYDADRELVGRPAEDISSSSDVAGQHHQAIIPGAYESSATSRGRSPAIGYDADREVVGRPSVGITNSSNVLGQHYQPTVPQNSDIYPDLAGPPASSPYYSDTAVGNAGEYAGTQRLDPKSGRIASDSPTQFTQQPIGGRILRDRVPKLYASVATPPGGMWVPADYLEGSKQKPVEGKLLRESVYGCLAQSTIVPEALRVLPSPMSDLQKRDGAGLREENGNNIHSNVTPSQSSETGLKQPSFLADDKCTDGTAPARDQRQSRPQNVIQSKSVPHSDTMFARVTAHSPTDLELDPQDTLSPQVAALSIEIQPGFVSELGDSSTEKVPVPRPVYSCVHCKETIGPGEVVVCADRAGADAAWHPKCFVCNTCEELLVDLMYFFHEGRVFCGRHFAQLLDIPRCKACDELIFVREYTLAEGEAFHVKHFCCFECDEPLAEKPQGEYLPHNGHPVCLDCFKRKYGKICRTCGLDIDVRGRRVGRDDMCWHSDPACFRCFTCHKSLLDSRCVLSQQQPFCSKACVLEAKEATS